MAKSLKSTKTHENLKNAFAGESQANRRYLYFARRADIEGYPDVGGLFRDTSEAETGHAFGHLDFLKEVGDPCTGVPIGSTENNLKSAALARPLATKASRKSPNGSRRWRGPRSRTPDASPRASKDWQSYSQQRGLRVPAPKPRVAWAAGRR
jgi:hypothetical protein